MNKNVLGIIITVVVLALIGGYFLLTSNNQSQTASVDQQPPVDQQTNNPPPAAEPAPSTQGTTHEVIYTDSGYSPNEITIKLGETVTWKNESSGGMWTASGMHPTHTIYSGTSLDEHCPDAQNISFDECTAAQPGQSWSFTFLKKGTWRYHNHVSPSNFGTVIVQ